MERHTPAWTGQYATLRRENDSAKSPGVHPSVTIITTPATAAGTKTTNTPLDLLQRAFSRHHYSDATPHEETMQQTLHARCAAAVNIIPGDDYHDPQIQRLLSSECLEPEHSWDIPCRLQSTQGSAPPQSAEIQGSFLKRPRPPRNPPFTRYTQDSGRPNLPTSERFSGVRAVFH